MKSREAANITGTCQLDSVWKQCADNAGFSAPFVLYNKLEGKKKVCEKISFNFSYLGQYA